MAIEIENLRQMVVDFCQDDPEMNTILPKREFTDQMVRMAIILMVSDFNQIHITTGFTVKSFPPNTESIQVYGTVHHLLNMATVLQVRNHLPYNDSGLSVAQYAKSGEYAGIADRFKGIFESKALNVKFQMNIAAGYGAVPSEYAFFGGNATIFGHSSAL